ncbi:MAG: tetratricopeptide repeat protein [Gemmatimonadota bacterium]|jgi:tetratricopeptide (TPR) repeat protein
MKSDADILIRRAQESFDRRDYVAALADFRDVVKDHPDFADVRHQMGLCLSFLGQPEEALAEFERALQSNDGYVAAHLNRAITLTELGRYDEASEAFERAAACEQEAGARYPASVAARLANAHASVGELYLAASDPDQAAEEFRRGLALRPTFHDIRNRLGEALMRRGELEQAREEFERTLAGNGRFMQARLNLGLVHFRSGRYDEAREAWEECRSQAPTSAQVRAYLRLLDERTASRNAAE